MSEVRGQQSSLQPGAIVATQIFLLSQHDSLFTGEFTSIGNKSSSQ